MLGGEDDILCARGLQDLGPLVGIKELGSELVAEVGVGEARRIVLFHEIHIALGRLWTLPTPPKPDQNANMN